MPMMPHSKEADEGDNPTFKWGKKRGVGGAKKEIRFYESFTYDEIEYFLYDCVYMYKEGEHEPYIGKLIKIWEQNHKRKVKVLWFFRPLELLNFLGDDQVLENEILLASGEGQGLANVNPLEAIAGKCNVLCTSKDERNPRPSEDDIKMADYIFYRTFDVGSCTVSDKIGDKIAGVEVRCIFNRNVEQKPTIIPKLQVTQKDVSGKIDVFPLPPKLDSRDTGENLVNTEKPAAMNAAAKDADSSPSFVNFGKGTLRESFSKDETIPRERTDSDKDEGKAGKVVARQAGVREKMKPVRDSNAFDSRPSKKLRVDDDSAKAFLELQRNVSSLSVPDKGKIDNSMRNLRVESDVENEKASEVHVSSSEDKSKARPLGSSVGNKEVSKKMKPDEKKAKFSDGTLQKAASALAQERDNKTEGQILEVTRRPDVDRSKWFKGLPWEERLQDADKQGTLVLLENLDPSYTSTEIEDLIWAGFRESCTAKVIQRTMISSPFCGEAFVIFKTKEAAEMAVRKLDQGCLMLPNGRPLVGSKRSPALQGKQTQFVGHLFIDKVKLQMQREELRKAISTSHCSQPNTIEYEMAKEWMLLQAKSDIWWKDLYKQQGEEIRKLKSSLKSK